MAAPAITKVLSRDFKIYINTGTVAVPVWTQVKGLAKDGGISLSPSVGDADFGDADDGGWKKTLPIERGWDVALKGDRLEDPVAGTRDTGQAAVEAVMGEIGVGALAGFKLASPATTSEERFFYAWAEVTPLGGSDKSSWEATLHVWGDFGEAL
jgi:hypothetical protein